jgi:tRNA (guanine-N7-)-methyltransferase
MLDVVMEAFSVRGSLPSLADQKTSDSDLGLKFASLKTIVGLSPLFPDKLILGMEIRTKVVEYVSQRITDLREKNASTKGSFLSLP